MSIIFAKAPRVDPAERAAVLSRLWLDVKAARLAIARGRPSAIEHTARGLLSALAGARVRVELAYAAAAFADALEERPDAEAWVSCAVSARATLEHAVKSGASGLTEELAELDASYEDARDAVLLLEPEDYKEALCGTPPSGGAWWCERARVDASLKEIDLERALGSLAR
ncbi:MAG: hypothetical protein KF819_04540 [Labilithrix sp.]|nr:hypothetical protein [Labilithrix sp.]